MPESEEVRVSFKASNFLKNTQIPEDADLTEIEREEFSHLLKMFWSLYHVPMERRIKPDLENMTVEVFCKDFDGLWAFILNHECKYDFSSNMGAWSTNVVKIFNIELRTLS